MRMAPAGYLALKNPRGTPSRSKRKPPAQVAHISAPLQGLSHFADLNEANPMLASILTNWVVEDDRITVRPGYTKMGQIAGNPPIDTIIPFYGVPQRLAFAAGDFIYDAAGAYLAGPFATGINGVWSWTSFSNLSSIDYTIMTNAVSGVWSWDGSAAFVQEAITVPAGEPWIDPHKFDKVLSHMNRLWFADSENLALYYLPIQQKSGQVDLFPLDVIFKRGGHIMALYTWTVDGGVGMDDAIAIFSSNGEVAIYSGVDPDSDFNLVGIFRFDAPMSKDCIVNFGGDLYVMVSTGLVPMTTMIRAESEQLGKSDLNVMREFEEQSRNHRSEPGWQVMINHHTGHAICNMPVGGGDYQQMVRKMPGQIWMKWEDLPARCWGWISNQSYFGSNDGGIYLMGPEYLSDNGVPIDADVRFAWSSFRSVVKKNFKLMRLYSITDGHPRPYMDVEVDYNNQPPTNQPELTEGPSGGADWDTATWDVDAWATNSQPRQNWQGITGLGRVGAPRVRVSVLGCTLSLTGVDVLYELGTIV